MKFSIFSSKGEREIETPESWAGMSTAMWVRYMTEWDWADMVKLFSILTGMEYKVIHKSRDIGFEEQLLIATRFIYDEPQAFKTAPFPETFKFKDKEVTLTKEIGRLSIGQNIHVRQKIDQCKIYDELISYTIAIFIQPLLDDSDFDFDKAMELVPEIDKMPITVTYPVGFFLLKPLMKNGWNFSIILNRVKILLQKAFTRSGRISLKLRISKE